jgi:hypothetical protein
MANDQEMKLKSQKYQSASIDKKLRPAVYQYLSRKNNRPHKLDLGY